jgi:prevent-host-death family protein
MPVTHIPSRTFNHDLSGAKRAALEGPVIVTDRGKPSHVLLSYDEYLQLSDHKPSSLVEALRMSGLGADDFDFEVEQVNLKIRDVEFD